MSPNEPLHKSPPRANAYNDFKPNQAKFSSMTLVGVLTKPGPTKLGMTKSGHKHSDIGLGLGNKVKDRVRD